MVPNRRLKTSRVSLLGMGPKVMPLLRRPPPPVKCNIPQLRWIDPTGLSRGIVEPIREVS